jgi:hypothetical protein
VSRRIAFAAVTLVAATAAVGSLALATVTPPAAKVRVTPVSGTASTVFVVSFTTPERTGLLGEIQRHDMLSATGPAGRRGCIATLPQTRAPVALAGARVHVALAPRQLGGRWCAGTYKGQIEQWQSLVCPHGELCPDVVLFKRVGAFTLHVRAAAPRAGGAETTPPSGGGTTPPSGGGTPPSGGGGTPPTFAGLQSAFACTPGPQSPGQTTPFTLNWQAATDAVTPSSEIVYDVYVATTPGGESFSKPTWTTPAGVTTYQTPGLASHGDFYFVVRARDQAGNEDHNTVEVHGVDPCE